MSKYDINDTFFTGEVIEVYRYDDSYSKNTAKYGILCEFVCADDRFLRVTLMNAKKFAAGLIEFTGPDFAMNLHEIDRIIIPPFHDEDGDKYEEYLNEYLKRSQKNPVGGEVDSPNIVE